MFLKLHLDVCSFMKEFQEISNLSTMILFAVTGTKHRNAISKSFRLTFHVYFSHDYLCNVNQLEDCAMSTGYTGHFNNLDYSICIQEEYGFCGIEYYPEKDELGSFSMTNKTELFIDEENKSHTG